MRKSVLGAFLIAMSTSAAAAEWELVTISSNDSIYFIDRSSVRSASDAFGPYRMAWVETDDSLNKKVKYRSSKILYRARCNKYELGVAQYINYNPDGSVMDSETIGYVRYSVVAPETVGYSILEQICWPTKSSS
jgi:hypothetical protein